MWKTIPEYPNYAINEDGKVMRILSRKCAKAGTILKTHVDPAGYKSLSLVNECGVRTKRIHRLVALAFLGARPVMHEINHRDGDKLNCSVNNLEYCTRQQNAAHAAQLGLMPRGEKSPASKLSNETVRQMRRLRKKGVILTKLANQFGCAVSHVHRIVTGQSRREETYYG